MVFLRLVFFVSFLLWSAGAFGQAPALSTESLFYFEVGGNVPDSFITLRWTAPGDDSLTGTAQSYDLRYDYQPLTEDSWPGCYTIAGTPGPEQAGTKQSFAFPVPAFDTTLYFAIRTIDDAGNVSAISNVAEVHVSGQISEPTLVVISIYPDSVAWSDSLYGYYIQPKPGLIAGKFKRYDAEGAYLGDSIHIGILPQFRYNTYYGDDEVNGSDFKALFDFVMKKSL